MSKTFSWEEVRKHTTAQDLWLVIDNGVYDITSFLEKHPGGAAVMLNVAGKDATSAFSAIHGKGMLKLVKKLHIGTIEAAPEAVTAVVDTDVPDRPHPASIAPPGMMGRIKNVALNLAGDAIGLGASAIYNGVLSPIEWLQRTVAPIRPLKPGTAEKPVKVAIVGGGCAGLSAAWALINTGGFDVTVLEGAEEVGGHAFTWQYRTPEGGTIPVDMGFIFGNHRSYKNMLKVMEKIDSKPIDTELSLSVDINGCKYATDGTICEGMKADTKMTKEGKAECDRFHDLCERWWENAAFNLVPFGAVLTAYGFSQEFRDLYVTPTLITLFISKQSLYTMSARFMFNMFGGPNKFVDLRRGWLCFTVVGGTNPGWIQRLAAGFRENIRTDAKVSAVTRLNGGGVKVEWQHKEEKRNGVFDHVLMACGAKVADSILQEKSFLERIFFGQMRYEGEHIVLHSDQSFMPKDKSLWRNFNYKDRPGKDLPELTGSMAHVSRVPTSSKPPMLTMNPMRPIAKKDIQHERFCAVHVQDLRHMIATRILLPAIGGNGGVWYCGSWANYLGHSGALDAGLATAARIGANYPIEDSIARDEFYRNACYDLFGPRYAWKDPILRHEAAKKKKAKL